MSFKDNNNVGLYLTIAFHLLILIILLVGRINYMLREDSSFIIDFTREEMLRELERQEELKEDISEELDRLLSGNSPARNVVTDITSEKGEELRDDRYENPSQVYEEARELEKKMEAAKNDINESDLEVNTKENQSPSKEETSEKSYKGPSVISYFLKDRKAAHLPIPVYKCIGGGDVAVAIVVNRQGEVTNATVIPDRSAQDNCLREYAIGAAKSSRFTSSAEAPHRQTGEIVYRFIAQ
jgi:hypothetical protein